MSGKPVHPRLRRTLFFGLTFLTAGAATALMLDALRANGLSAVELIGVALFFCLFTWISGALWTALAGFAVRLSGSDRGGLDLAALAGRPLTTRTALVMPIYNEDTERVGAGLAAIWNSLQGEADQAAFDLFILSDSTNAAIAAAEERLWARLCELPGAAGRVFYRRRTDRRGHKAGNIDEFVRHRSKGYECMLVLDADSIMSGAALVALARAMEAHPRIGIVQSLPLAVGRETLFGRLIQFGSRLQSPMLGSGLAWWQLGESNYWGHNAILRIRPFAEHCDLPVLPGRPPFGGTILSHDFVEAAFMRRAGYEVRVVPQLEGSWEEVPGNILDYAARDRRWAQGNLQHSRLLTAAGLHPLSRIHLITGIMSYVSSPMWLSLLLLSSVLSIIESAKRPQYFLPGAATMFPAWPQFRGQQTLVLIGITLVVLVLPKVLGAVLAVRDPVLRRGYGGARRLAAGLVLEQFFSMLLAPPMMLFHATFVAQILLGRGVNWGAQDRGERGVSFAEAMKRQRGQLIAGIIWIALIAWLAPRFFLWLTPVFLGLLCAIPLTVYTSRASAGAAARRRGLFLVPEESDPPPELRALAEFTAPAPAVAPPAAATSADPRRVA
ncbi:MAG: glucans biosynthesis glucosyltransferase MdoH [Proteobacteria bacterium]|nr:glucans biosynthesis glucosyltransferase MdoH [Pseudomonadota bacterium]